MGSLSLDEIRDVRGQERLLVKWGTSLGRWEKLQRATGIPKRFFGRSLDDVDTDALNRSMLTRAKAFLAGFEDSWEEGIGVTLIGPAGVGKTTVACLIGTELAKRGYVVRFVSITDLIGRLQEQYVLDARRSDAAAAERWASNFAWIETIRDAAHLLIIDDVGKEKSSEFTQSVFDRILRHRYDEGLPTVLTSNIDIGKWSDAYSAAMEDFLYEATSVVVVSGPSRRHR